MTDEEAQQAETYISKMTKQNVFANVVLLILRPIAIESESVFLEVFGAAPVGRPKIPVIGVLPRGENLEEWNGY